MLETECRIKELQDKINVLLKKEIMWKRNVHVHLKVYIKIHKKIKLKQNLIFQLEDDNLKLN